MSALLEQRTSARAEAEPAAVVVLHYLRKDDITRGIVLGAPATALCGNFATPVAPGAAGDGPSVQVVCPECERRFSMLL
ncbi:DUF3039 domain-containing protein [Cellulomonas sp.]|uniref:DUF3039 domain-containing protein n=1 Tax=Cellulomonas sp. TaxID=40001 RepID=UPI001B2DF6E9|nr:DUF3039 domain-containing protein [Cellulomonas sp.]MBO9555550.1 DUF3039 domain-containing protein [Cellulomonas sp.]